MNTVSARFSRRALLGSAASVMVGAAAAQLFFFRGSGTSPLMRAYRKAQLTGKPLLVRILSEDPRESGAVNAERREAFADLYSGGDIQELAPLALCDSIELTLAEVSSQLQLSPLVGGLELVLVETAGSEPTGIFFAPLLHIEQLNLPRPQRTCGNLSPQERWQLRHAQDAATEQVSAYRESQRPLRVRRLAQALVSSLTPNTAALERRAKQSSDALKDSERKAVAQAIAQRLVPSPLLCHRAAAVIALAAARTSDVAFREGLVRELAAVARRSRPG